MIDDGDRPRAARRAAGSGADAAGTLLARRDSRSRRLAQLPNRRLRHVAVGTRAARDGDADRMPFPRALLDSATRVARYVSALALTNCFDVWEEHGSSRHVSTLACVFGGLHAAARMLGMEDLAGARGRRPAGRARGDDAAWPLRQVDRLRRRGLEPALAGYSVRAGRTQRSAFHRHGARDRGSADLRRGSAPLSDRHVLRQRRLAGSDRFTRLALRGRGRPCRRAPMPGMDRRPLRRGGSARRAVRRRNAATRATTTSGSSAGVHQQPTSPGPTRCTWCSARNWKPKQTSSRELPDDGRATWKDPSGGLGQAVPE